MQSAESDLYTRTHTHTAADGQEKEKRECERIGRKLTKIVKERKRD